MVYTVGVHKMALRFSKSKLGDYKNCPRKYYLSNFTLMGSIRPEFQPDYLINGTTCHTYFENYNKGLENNVLPNYNEFVATNIQNFHKLLEQYGLGRAEYAEWKQYDPELDLVVVVDAIYKKEDVDKKGNPVTKYILIDYKTGKLYAPKIAELRFELSLYAFMAQKFLGITIDQVGMFYTNYPESSFVENITQKKITKAMEKYHERVAKINGLNFERIRGPLCKNCDFIACCETYKDDIVD